ncbi:condensation domain-containing protein [Chitinivorax sp. B]|uniref:condensation domain-containing protein n=1 Tax=Chitinivorax sp. B TaxID=2502235 RepID=UPI0010F698F6|nr:condensation domain-containing protein [Chitinivorax sp. B]
MHQNSQRLATTTAQFSIWVAQLDDENSPGFWTAETVELTGELDVVAFQTTVREVLDHCHTLHMRFEWEAGTLWQHPQPANTQVQWLDFSGQPDPALAAHDWIAAAVAQPCDVTQDALYATALLKVSPTQHWWYLQVHHIVLDGFGYSLVQQAVAQRYNARVRQQPLPGLPDWQLHKVIEAEVTYKQNGGFEQDRDFWLQHLSDVPPLVELEPLCEPSAEPIRQHLELTQQEVTGLQTAARVTGGDWAAWMLSAIGLWMGKQANLRHFTIGMPVMNRLGTPAVGVPCMAMNIVPLSMRLEAEDSLQALVQATGQQLRAIRPHLYYRYGWMRRDLGLFETDTFLFNQAVNLMPFDRQVSFAGVQSRMRPVTGGPVKDFNIALVVLNNVWQLTLEANANAYQADAIAAMARNLHQWLNQLVQTAPGVGLAELLPDLFLAEIEGV